MLTKTITLTKKEHGNQAQIFLEFDYDQELIRLARSLGARWSKTNNAWYVPDAKGVTNAIFKTYSGTA